LKKKTRSIFWLFIVPLIIILLFQAVISVGSIILSNTVGILDEYAVQSQNQTVRNRNIILENNMVQQWSNVSECMEDFQNSYHEFLQENGSSPEEFLSNENQKEVWLDKITEQCLYMLRKNSVTGVFVVLANEQMDQETNHCKGIYFRDSDPVSNPGDYSDILLERGSAELSHRMDIPLDSYWSTDFAFGPSLEEKADDFFYQPYEAARKYPHAKYKDLAYWSGPFFMEDDTSKSGYEMISYTVPLIAEDGTVYGVLGTEISKFYLENYMPFQELNANDQSSYMIAQKQEDGTYLPFVVTGTLVAEKTKQQKMTLKNTKYDDFYHLGGLSDQELYGSVYSLRLYNTNTPFSKTEWIFLGMQKKQDLYGMGDTILRNLMLATAAAMIFGIFGVYIIVRYVTKPLRRLMVCVQQSTATKMRDFPASRVLEVDSLYQVLKNLSDKQRDSEYRLIEEKERYKIALQGSKDLFFSYDWEKDSVDIFNYPITEANDTGELHLEAIQEKCADTHWVHPDDMVKLKALLCLENPEFHLVYRGRDPQMEGESYQWMEISGKILWDADRKQAKAIGCLRNIHMQKIEELRRQESMQKDAVTGLYERYTGERLLEKRLGRGQKGMLALLDLDHFRELNEQYGMVFGDAILEEFGRLILLKKESLEACYPVLAVRMGGDEILLWFEGIEYEKLMEELRDLQNGLEGLYPGRQFFLQFSAGFFENNGFQSYEESLAKAQKALYVSKSRGGGHYLSYDWLTKADKEKSMEGGINEIASFQYKKQPKMISLAFNFFDKSNDIQNIMPVLLVKLGHFYRAKEISLMLLDRDFYSTYLSYYWQEDRQEDRKRVSHFSREFFESFVAKLEKGPLFFDDTQFLKEEEAEFLGISSSDRGVSIPMRDGGLYMGALSLVLWEDAKALDEQELRDLQEITKLMESNIQRQKYDQASRAKSDFLSRMSHEIRTPMNAIIGMTEIALHEEKKSPKVEDCLNKIDRSSKYLLELINDILDMSKIESGKMKLEITTFYLKDFLEEIQIMVLPQAQSKELQFIIDCGDTDLWLRGDALRLSQVLINLLGNAVKFTPPKKTVTLTVRQESQEGKYVNMYFSVKDTGIGVDPENADRIFESFEQVENSNTVSIYGGTGLGLSISNHLVHMMGGQIQLESQLGEGSDFYFRIPLEIGHPTVKAEDKVCHFQGFQGKRLLLVEDNELNVEIAKTLLEAEGFVVETAYNGKEAVDAYLDKGKGYFSCILMDIRMPVMNGLDAAKAIRQSDMEDAGRIPIIAMTANAFDEDMKKSIESGMNGHLTKPLDMRKLLKMLEELV
jgi:diguanylate cyclase (GGDEF)-like protein